MLTRLRPLLQLPILPPRLLHLTRLLLARALSPNRIPALIALQQSLDFISQDLPRDLLILGSGARGLRFHHYAGGFVDELDGGVGFVLLIA